MVLKFRSDFDGREPFRTNSIRDFERFLEEQWIHVDSQIVNISISTSKNKFLKDHCFTFGKRIC